jgi:hypothetical protein
MGRYLLMAAAEKYLERRSVPVGKSTIAYERRKVRHIVSEIEAMRENGIIKTSNPTDIGPVEIRAFIDWMRNPQAHKDKSLDPDTQVRYLSNLDGILKMYGNHVIEMMRDEGYQLPQKLGKKPIRAIAEPDLEII